VIGLTMCIDFSVSIQKFLTWMCIDLCFIVIQPINIEEKDREDMMFTTIAWIKYLNGLPFQLPLSYNRYENMAKLTVVRIRIVEENSLRLTKMKTIDHNEDYNYQRLIILLGKRKYIPDIKLIVYSIFLIHILFRLNCPK